MPEGKRGPVDPHRRHFIAGSAAALVGLGGLAAVTAATGAEPELPVESDDGTWLVDVTEFGATGDGTTDDSSAIRAAIAAALATRQAGVMRAIVLFPPGTYRVTQPDTLLWSPTDGESDQVFGLYLLGFGPRVSEVFFDTGATASADPRQNNLITAAVRVRYLQVSQMSFRSANQAQSFAYFWSVDRLDAGSVYPEYGRGQNQNITFDRVAWLGQWNRVVGIDGDQNANNNSEWHFRQCSTMSSPRFADAFLHCGMTSPETSNAQNQFLNFQLEFCHMLIEQGVMFRFDRGGSINVVGGSWSTSSADTGPATYFLFPRGGVDHAASRLLVQGVRFEPKRPDHRIIDCSWGAGHVTFVSCSDSASLQYPEASEFTLHEYRAQGSQLPIVRYSDCALAGTHRVETGAARPSRGRLLYEGCRLYHHDEATGPQGFLRGDQVLPTYAFRDGWNAADESG